MGTPNFKPCTVWVCDNIEIMRGMNSECIDLIYLDPPFNSNKNYENPIGMATAVHDSYGDEIGSFKDIWTLSDLKEHEHGELADRNPALYKVIDASRQSHGEPMMAYLIMMSVRLLEMHRILKPTGSIYLHCDPTAGHYLKLVMDCIFGSYNFRNEIVWGYTGPGSSKMRQFSRKHDNIFWYSKSNTWTFNSDAVRIQYKDGGPHKGGKFKYYNDGGLDSEKVNAYGRKGKIPETWWVQEPGNGLCIVARSKKENTGYPTQKPIKLLERIIKASSNKGDLVFDPFCGCATTLVAANNLERNWIGCDLSEMTVGLVKKRMDDAKGTLPGMFDSNDVITLDSPPVRTDIHGDIPDYKSNKHVLFSIQKGICVGCHIQFPFVNFTIDHIVPQAKGGQDNFDNLQLLCNFCNASKWTKSMPEWLATRDKSYFPNYNSKFNPRAG